MVAFIAVLYLVSFVGLSAWFARTEGYVSLVVVFGITGFYYYLAVPLELWCRGEHYVWGAGLSYAVPPDVQLKICIMGLLALIAFALGLRCSGFRLAPLASMSTGPAVSVPRSMQLLGLAALSLIVAGYGASAIRGLGDYYEGHAIRHQHPLLSAAIQYLLLSLVVIAVTLMHGSNLQRLTAAAIAVLVAGWGFYSQDKDPIVLACIGFLARYLGRPSRGFRSLVLVCAGAFLAIGGLPLFSAYRGGSGADLSRLWRDFSVLDTDAAGPAMSLAITAAGDPEWRFGETYLLNAALLIPRRLWPDRPPSLAEQFAIENMPPERWFEGAGYGFSLLAEAYINFGVPGAFVQYFALGWLMGRVWMWTGVRFGRENWAYWKALYVCSAFMCVVLMHRGGTNQIARYMIYYVAIPWLLFAIMDAQGFASRRHRVGWKRGMCHARSLDPQLPS